MRGVLDVHHFPDFHWGRLGLRARPRRRSLRLLLGIVCWGRTYGIDGRRPRLASNKETAARSGAERTSMFFIHPVAVAVAVLGISIEVAVRHVIVAVNAILGLLIEVSDVRVGEFSGKH